jgi:HAD superfamily hydrolase (TIGR01549 family)
MSVRAWLVDLDGTLYSPLPVKLLLGLELVLFGRHSMRGVQAFRAEHERLRVAGSAHENLFFAQLDAAALRAGIDRDELRAVVEDFMFERPGRYLGWFRRRGLLREIERFRTDGGRTAIVSDYPAEKKLAALGVRRLFDCVVAVGEAESPQRLKPAPDGYLRAAELLAVEPSECLVLGDRVDADGEAARAAGMSFRRV